MAEYANAAGAARHRRWSALVAAALLLNLVVIAALVTVLVSGSASEWLAGNLGFATEAELVRAEERAEHAQRLAAGAQESLAQLEADLASVTEAAEALTEWRDSICSLVEDSYVVARDRVAPFLLDEEFLDLFSTCEPR